jgi:hypothetical protein
MRNPNVTNLHFVGSVYLALIQAIALTFGRDIEPAANRILSEMMGGMDPDAAAMCKMLIESGSQHEPTRTADLMTLH